TLQQAVQSGLIRLPEGYQPGQPLMVDQRVWQQLAPELTKTPHQRELERIQLTQAQLALQDLQSRFTSGLIPRSEEHTSELQSRENLVCRLLLEKKKNKQDFN